MPIIINFFVFKKKKSFCDGKNVCFDRFFNYEYDQNPYEYDQNLNEWKKDTDECTFYYNLLLNMLIFVHGGVDSNRKSENIVFMVRSAENYNL